MTREPSRDELRAILQRDVVEGAMRLLGCTIVHPDGAARIVETEAYRGSDDPGCHAFGRVRMKNMALFGPPGTAYVYRSYGIHQMLNLVCLPEGLAGGILIRALRPLDKTRNALDDSPSKELSGPGKLARTLGVNEHLNGIDLLDEQGLLWIEPAPLVTDILVGPRIGLSPEKGEQTPWRFVSARDLQWVSATRKGLQPLQISTR